MTLITETSDLQAVVDSLPQYTEGFISGPGKQRSKPSAWLVKHEETGLGHQSAAYCQHLLFAAAHCPRVLPPPLCQSGKKIQNE
jgi:hypothetical protein